MADTLSLRDRACIVGIGETEYVKGTPKTRLQLALQASMAAIEDAGLKPQEIDAVVLPNGSAGGGAAGDLAANLGLGDVRFTTSLQEMGGAQCVASLEVAAMVIASGIAKHVLIPIAVQWTSGPSARAFYEQQGTGLQSVETIRDFYVPFGVGAPAQHYAWMAQRHMSIYGTKHEHLGAVAVAMRKHAQLHPKALMRGKPMTMEDYLAARWISKPYRLFDCSLENDGAAALVVSSAERARDMKQKPVYLSGIATGHPYPPQDIPNRPDILTIGLDFAAPAAYAMSGLTPADMDFAQIYDCFTGQTLLQIEAAGFCKKGEGGPFVEGGRIELGGQLPVNTHGGLLSQAHVNGMNHIVEAVVQLRGDGGERQVKDAEFGAVSGWGGHAHGALAILRR